MQTLLYKNLNLCPCCIYGLLTWTYIIWGYLLNQLSMLFRGQPQLTCKQTQTYFVRKLACVWIFIIIIVTYSTLNNSSHCFHCTVQFHKCLCGVGGGVTSPTFRNRLEDPWPLSCYHGNWPICLLHMKVRAKELGSKCKTGSDWLTDRQTGIAVRM